MDQKNYFDAVIAMLAKKPSEFHLIVDDKYPHGKDVVRRLLGMILWARHHSVRITVHYLNRPELQPDQRSLRIFMFAELGCDIATYVLHHHFAGTVPWGCFSEKGPFLAWDQNRETGTFIHQDGMELLKGFRPFVAEHYSFGHHVPELKKAKAEDYWDILRKVPCYNDCSFEMRKVALQDVVPRQAKMLHYKLRQNAFVRDLMREYGLSLWDPCSINLRTYRETPYLFHMPITEYDNGDGILIVADGHHRLYETPGKQIVTAVHGCEATRWFSRYRWEQKQVLKSDIEEHLKTERNPLETRNIPGITNKLVGMTDFCLR